jgi:proteasome activator subunit 4
MTIIPDVSRLVLDDPGPEMHQTQIPDDIDHATDRYMQKLKLYAKSIPYAIESNARMQDMLDLILRRITQCVEAKDFEPGLVQWDSMIT